MTDWQTKKLGEIAKINLGQSPESSSYNESGVGVPLIQGNADIKFGKTIKRIWTTNPTKIAPAGSVIMTVRAPVGALGFTEFECCLGRGVCSISSDSINFINYYLEYFERQWSSFIQGSTFEAVNGSDIRGLTLKIPEKLEQQRIVSVLETWDEYLELLDKKIALKERLKKGLMQNYFKSNKNNECTIELKDVIKSFSTGLNPRRNFELGHGNNNYITIKNISNGSIILKGAEKIDDDALLMIARRSHLEKGDVIMASIGNVGEAYLLTENPIGWNINESVFNLKPKQSVILPEYLYYFISSDCAKGFFDNHISGSSFKSIKMKDLRMMPFNKISIEEQRKAVDVLSGIDSQLQLLGCKKQSLLLQKKYLLKNLITGKIRTPENLKIKEANNA